MKIIIKKPILTFLRLSAISLMSITIFTVVMEHKVTPNEADAQCVALPTSSTVTLINCSDSSLTGLGWLTCPAGNVLTGYFTGELLTREVRCCQIAVTH